MSDRDRREKPSRYSGGDKTSWGDIAVGIAGVAGILLILWGLMMGIADAHEIPRTRDLAPVVCELPDVLLPADEDGEYHHHRLSDCLTQLEWVNRGRHIPRVTARVNTAINRTSVSVSAGVQQWASLVGVYFAPADVPWALRVMACESGGDPNAYNPSTATGLFQIKTFWTRDYPGNLYDPTHNVATAAAIFYTYGSHHWVCK